MKIILDERAIYESKMAQIFIERETMKLLRLN